MAHDQSDTAFSGQQLFDILERMAWPLEFFFPPGMVWFFSTQDTFK
jgi:hypothetical protein